MKRSVTDSVPQGPENPMRRIFAVGQVLLGIAAVATILMSVFVLEERVNKLVDRRVNAQLEELKIQDAVQGLDERVSRLESYHGSASPAIQGVIDALAARVDLLEAADSNFSIAMVERREWYQGSAAQRLIPRSAGTCALVGISGAFNGAGERVRVYVDESPDDGEPWWYIGGDSRALDVMEKPCVSVLPL